MNKIERAYYNIVDGVGNIFKYIKTIWKTRDWDYGFILELEYEKIKRMIRWFEKNNMGHTTSGPEIYRDLKLAKHLLDIYLENDTDWYEVIWYRSGIKSDMWDSNSHEWICHKYVNTNNRKRFFKVDFMKPVEDLYKIELYKEKAWRLYCKLREYKMRNWWD